MMNMNPKDRPPSPRFLQTDITNVFTDVIKTMSDQRNNVKWNRDVARKDNHHEISIEDHSSVTSMEVKR